MFVDERAEGLAMIRRGLDKVLACDAAVADADDTARLIVELERQARRLDAARVDVMDRVDAGGAHRPDGHFSAKVMVRHHAMLSGAEAWARDRVRRMLNDLPALAGLYRAGRVGTDQIRRLAKVWSNPRVRQFVPLCEAVFIDAAATMEFIEFDRLLTQWEALVDEDGSDRNARRHHRDRTVTLTQDYNTTWHLHAQLSSLDGADLSEMIEHLAQAERLSDIDAANAAHGDNWRLHLARSDGQLRYDALMTLIRRGAAASPETGDTTRLTDIVIDEQTLQRETNKLLGHPVDPINPLDALTDPPTCHTADGIPLHPAEAVTHALFGHLRRVVYNTTSTVIDVGRKQRLFTGSARDAALLQSLMCYWKGCWIPASHCQIDHLQPWNDGGQTNPGNGAPACGHHNRLKQHGYHAWRTPDGTWHLTRPGGTPVPDHTTHWDNPWTDAA